MEVLSIVLIVERSGLKHIVNHHNREYKPSLLWWFYTSFYIIPNQYNKFHLLPY